MTITAAKGKFPLGQMVMTRGVAERCKVNDGFNAFVFFSIGRHARGDWGDLDEGDRQVNEAALKDGDRLLSAYDKEGLPRIWIITEWDRSVTTCLFPIERRVDKGSVM